MRLPWPSWLLAAIELTALLVPCYCTDTTLELALPTLDTSDRDTLTLSGRLICNHGPSNVTMVSFTDRERVKKMQPPLAVKIIEKEEKGVFKLIANASSFTPSVDPILVILHKCNRECIEEATLTIPLYLFHERDGLAPRKTVELAQRFPSHLSREFCSREPLDSDDDPFKYLDRSLDRTLKPNSSVDYRYFLPKRLSPVIAQKCGDCYAIATAGAVEGMERVGQPYLSSQMIADCSKPFENHGCISGEPYKALRFVQEFGLATAESYPYTGENTTQCFNDYKIGARIKSYAKVYSLNAVELMQVLSYNGPVVANVITPKSFEKYNSSTLIYDDPACKPKPKSTSNHAILIVGYNTTADGKKFWILKNSWGDKWGHDGFMYLTRADDYYNPCELLWSAYYPTD